MKRLLLLGGGHAHVLVLLNFANFISKNLDVKLVTPGPLHTYSGMVPGVVAGHYAVPEAQIDLARLAARAGAELVLDRVVSFDAAESRSRETGTARIRPAVAQSRIVAQLPGRPRRPGARDRGQAVRAISRALAQAAADGAEGAAHRDRGRGRRRRGTRDGDEARVSTARTRHRSGAVFRRGFFSSAGRPQNSAFAEKAGDRFQVRHPGDRRGIRAHRRLPLGAGAIRCAVLGRRRRAAAAAAQIRLSTATGTATCWWTKRCAAFRTRRFSPPATRRRWRAPVCRNPASTPSGKARCWRRT